MTAAHRRAARREQQVADLLGTQRVKFRPRFQRSPDCVPIRLADGSVIVPESKTRKALPKWITTAIGQARGYVEGSIPLVVVSELRGEPLALVPLADLARLVGLREPEAGEQLVLLGRSQ